MQDNFDFASHSALEDLSSELNKQKELGKAFKVAFFTLFTFGIVVVVWQITKKKQKKVINEPDYFVNLK